MPVKPEVPYPSFVSLSQSVPKTWCLCVLSFCWMSLTISAIHHLICQSVSENYHRWLPAYCLPVDRAVLLFYLKFYNLSDKTQLQSGACQWVAQNRVFQILSLQILWRRIDRSFLRCTLIVLWQDSIFITKFNSLSFVNRHFRIDTLNIGFQVVLFCSIRIHD